MKVSVQIEGVEFRMEVETGAADQSYTTQIMSGISSTLQCDPVEISFPSYAGALLDIAGQIVCTEQWLQCLFMLVIFLSYL